MSNRKARLKAGKRARKKKSHRSPQRLCIAPLVTTSSSSSPFEAVLFAISRGGPLEGGSLAKETWRECSFGFEVVGGIWVEGVPHVTFFPCSIAEELDKGREVEEAGGFGFNFSGFFFVVVPLLATLGVVVVKPSASSAGSEPA